MLIVTQEAYEKLSKSTRAELLRAVLGDPSSAQSLREDKSANSEEFDWTNRLDLTPGQIETFLSRDLHQNTVNGMRAIAERGSPISSVLLRELGVTDLAAFQRSTTRRVRSVSGDNEAFLLAWDDWNVGVGHYAVTPATLRSLQIYFERN